MPVLLPLAWFVGVSGWWFDLVFVLAVCPLMIAGGLRLQRFGKVAGWLGQVSFPLFALQMPILQGLRQLGAPYWLGGFVALAGGIGGAVLADWLKQRKRARQWENMA